MNILIKLLPIILILTVFYIFFTDLYPKYQEILTLVQKLNELKNKEKEISSTEELIKSLENNDLIKVFSQKRELLDAWLPQEPKIEELLIYFGSLYNAFSLSAQLPKITDDSEKRFYQEILPIKTLTFNLNFPTLTNYELFVSNLEKNVRLMRIKKINLNSKGVDLLGETYYLQKQ